MGAHVIAIADAATFAVPVLSLVLLRVREPAPGPRMQRWRTELVAGLRHVRRTAVLRRAVLAGALSTTVFGFAETITYAIAGQGLHERPAFVGVLVAVQGAGAIVGGPTAAPLIRRIGEARLMALGLAVAALGALLALPAALAPVLAGYVVFGMAIPWLVVALITLVQRVTPAQLQGRAYSAVDSAITVPQTLSIALGAGLITVTGYRPLLVAMAAVMAAAGAYLLRASDPSRLAPDARDPAAPVEVHRGEDRGDLLDGLGRAEQVPLP